MLIAMAGLPGAGKSTLAAEIGREFPAAVLAVDPVEAALLRAGISPGQPTGLAAYLVTEAVADGLLALGQSVVLDAVNAVTAARDQWRELAARHDVPVAFIEVVCSDVGLHRRRLAGRDRGLVGFAEPTWGLVERVRAEYQGWDGERLVVDSVEALKTNLGAALEYLAVVAEG